MQIHSPFWVRSKIHFQGSSAWDSDEKSSTSDSSLDSMDRELLGIPSKKTRALSRSNGNTSGDDEFLESDHEIPLQALKLNAAAEIRRRPSIIDLLKTCIPDSVTPEELNALEHKQTKLSPQRQQSTGQKCEDALRA